MADFRLQASLQRSNRQITYPHLPIFCPVGSCLAIRIVGFIFVTHAGARRGVGRVDLARAKIARKFGAPGHRPPSRHITKHHQNSPCSTAPCTMFQTFLQVEWWLHGQLIVYIIDLCCRYFGRNKLLWSSQHLKCGHGKLPSGGKSLQSWSISRPYERSNAANTTTVVR